MDRRRLMYDADGRVLFHLFHLLSKTTSALVCNEIGQADAGTVPERFVGGSQTTTIRLNWLDSV
jgi:hypothetical protein